MIRAALDGGAQLTGPEQASAIIWGGHGPDGLADVLANASGVHWVQLPAAGIEAYRELVDDGRSWTSAKGVFGVHVAEHALALALAGYRNLPAYARARSWSEKGGRSLLDPAVGIVGAGGIAQALISLLQPFRCKITVVRRRPDSVPGALRVLPLRRLHEALADAQLVVLAAALTPETDGMIDEPALHSMRSDAWLVNVGRGRLVVTDALVLALRQGWIAGAALDVTDPEPLPAGHPLWTMPNCLITPHTANPPDLEPRDMAPRITENVRRRLAGEPLLGLVSAASGY
jgi:D-3-phosphoglycerate dehydrogenase